MSPPTSPPTRTFARSLRRTLTDAEVRLWSRLRQQDFGGTRFRRQVAIGPYVADFASLRPPIVVELDGSQHADAVEYDAARSTYLATRGFCVLRFWNGEVLAQTDDVMQAIFAAVMEAKGTSHSR